MKTVKTLALSAVATLAASALWATPALGVSTDAAWASQVDSVVESSPSDAVLKGASDAELIGLAVRCIPIDTETYCLHRGWDSQGTSSEALINAKRAAQAGTLAQSGSGDMSLLAVLHRWRSLSSSSRKALERQELAEAKTAVGKVVYFDAHINGRALPSDYAKRYPTLAAWAGVGAPTRQSAVQPNTPGNYSCSHPDGLELCYVMSGAYFSKQETGYYCGPTSMQGIAWNDPGGGIYKTQANWASILGTTQANGTYIGDIKNTINSYTTWDNYAGSYAVVSISSWSNSQWESLFRTHIQTKKSPVLLHPRFTGNNSDYYRGTTSGHFNVGRGYDTTVGYFAVMILEPAGGAAENNVYPYVSAEDHLDNVRLANLANSSQQTISY